MSRSQSTVASTAPALRGPAKAAIFLLSLTEDQAVKIVEHLADDELKKLRGAAETLGPLSADTVSLVHTQFADDFRSGLTYMRDGGGYFQSLVSRARGVEDAARLFQPPAPAALEGGAAAPAPKKPLAALLEADREVLAVALSSEHPQVRAALLAHLDPTLGAQVLGRMNAVEQCDVLRRIANLKKIPAAAFADAELGMGGLEAGVSTEGSVDGVRCAASILNELAPSHATDLIERLSQDHADEAVKLRRAMVTFEDLIESDQRGLQQLLREIQSETLLVALKTCSNALKQKLLACMSSRAATMLLEELELLAPVRRSEVRQAQQQIVDVAMRLCSEGKLNLRNRSDGEV